MTRRPDPFVAGLSSFAPRPGAKVNISRDNVADPSLDDVKNEWMQLPLPAECPTWQMVKGNHYYLRCYWALDWLGRPYVLLDEQGETVFTSTSLPSDNILKALDHVP